MAPGAHDVPLAAVHAAVYGGGSGNGVNPPVLLGFGIALLALGVLALLVAAFIGERVPRRVRLMLWILGGVWGAVGIPMTISGFILL